MKGKNRSESRNSDTLDSNLPELDEEFSEGDYSETEETGLSEMEDSEEGFIEDYDSNLGDLEDHEEDDLDLEEITEDLGEEEEEEWITYEEETKEEDLEEETNAEEENNNGLEEENNEEDFEEANEAKEEGWIEFVPYQFKCEDVTEVREPGSGEESFTRIAISGHTETSEKIFIFVDDFKPYVYLQLPTGPIGKRKPIKWTKSKRNMVFKHFKDALKLRGPLDYVAVTRRKLHYLDPILGLRMTFRTHKDTMNFASRVYNHRGLYIDGLGRFPYGYFRVHEHKLDPIIKFTAQRNLPTADWMRCLPLPSFEEIEGEPRTSVEKEYRASWSSFEVIPPKEMVFTKFNYLSFDIECYSKNHNSKKPDATEPENKVFQIGLTVGVDGVAESRETYLLTLFDPLDQPEYIKETFRFSSEKALIKGFAKFIRDRYPDLLYSYNGMGFDWDYLITRAKLLGCLDALCSISRIVDKVCPVETTTWSSNAYGEQNFKYLDPEGCINVDVLLEVQRNWKLNKYTLDAVSEHFQVGQKDPISARQLFMLYDLTETFLDKARVLAEKYPDEVPKGKRVEIKKVIKTILKKRWCSGPTLELRQDLMNFRSGPRFLYLIRKALTLTGRYCGQDTVLPVLISDKVGLRTTMQQTANIMKVPMSYLHTRGQQIKVVAQVYRDTVAQDIMIPFIPKDEIVEEKYMGATVIDVAPGNYDDILIFDFESLYPCMIITGNICYTTLLKEGDPTPDSECNLIWRKEHRGCEHDHSGNKVKKEDVLCLEKLYRFKKVIYLPDGTRLNEGVMPALERKLMSSRKAVKKEMFAVDVKIACATGKATDSDRKEWKSWGLETPEVGSLTAEQIDILKMYSKILNARQLALKVGANSAYGILGAQKGFIPFVIGAACVTAMGRGRIMNAIQYILRTFEGTKLVYGDTDSCLIQKKGLKEGELWPLGKKMAKSTTHYLKVSWLGMEEDLSFTHPKDQKLYRIDEFPRKDINLLEPDDRVKIYQYDGCPINLQLENYYKRLILLTKKRYYTYIANGDGKIIGKGKKGTVSVRREQSQFVKELYDKSAVAILDKAPRESIIENIINQTIALCSGQIKDASFIMYKGIANPMSYAKTDDDGNYLDREGNIIKDPENAADERLVYGSLPHVSLARRMIARGDDVVPNTRMEYVYLDTPSARVESDCTEDYTYYTEHKAIEHLRIDNFYYLRQLVKPFTELLDVNFPGDMVLYEPLETTIDREWYQVDAQERHKTNKLPPVVEYTPPKLSYFERCVGWAALDEDRPRYPPKPRTYTYKGLEAKYKHILDIIDGEYLEAKDPIDFELDPSCVLYQTILRYKSREIMKKLFKKYKSGIYKHHQPTNRNKVLSIKKDGKYREVMLAEDTFKEYGHPRGTVVKLQEVTEEKGVHYYKVLAPGGKMYKDLIREELAPFYLKDHFLLKDLYKAHVAHREICDEIKNRFLTLSEEELRFLPVNFTFEKKAKKAKAKKANV